MILLTNGCSFTWGGGLEKHFLINDKVHDDKRLPLVWPHHLGKLLNADRVVNLGLGCGSNQRITRTTLDWFLNEYKNNEPIVAVIQLTDPARYEYYLSDDIHDFTNDPYLWARITPSASLIKVKGYSPDDLAWRIRDFEVKKERNSRITTYTSVEGLYKIISDCFSLSYLFEKHNVEYYFFGGYFFYVNCPVKYKEFIIKNNYLDFDWRGVDTISEIDPHPSILGHEQLAQLVYQNIRPKQVLEFI